MYDDIETRLSTLGEPTAFDTKSFDEFLNELVDEAKIILGDDWQPLESDPYMKKLRVVALRKLHDQEDKKETVKQILITTATAIDLDNLGASKNVFRDLGEFPYTDFEFKLLALQDEDVVIPKGLVLADNENISFAKIIEDFTIKAGEESIIARAELEQYIEESDVKTENIITDLPFGIEIKQLDIYKNGASAESDDRYRIRIIASNNSLNTAGSEDAYKFFIFSADSRIDDVSIPEDNPPLEINIYLASFENEVDEIMKNRVYDVLSAKKTRPLSDLVSVFSAEKVEIVVNATIELFDMLQQNNIDTQIRNNFSNSFFIGQNFVKSDLIRKMHINGVYRVTSEFEDVIINDKQIITIKEINLNFKKAEL